MLILYLKWWILHWKWWILYSLSDQCPRSLACLSCVRRQSRDSASTASPHASWVVISRAAPTHLELSFHVQPPSFHVQPPRILSWSPLMVFYWFSPDLRLILIRVFARGFYKNDNSDRICRRICIKKDEHCIQNENCFKLQMTVSRRARTAHPSAQTTGTS